MDRIELGFETLRWDGGMDGTLILTDQRLLPGEYTRIQCETIEQVWDAIKTLAVRGAPAIGVAAAYGICVGMRTLNETASAEQAMKRLEECCGYLATSRPTAVNLFWALDRMTARAKELIRNQKNPDAGRVRTKLLEEAASIHGEDKAMCRAIGEAGEPLIPNRATLLTHCNAGALATAGLGTALAPMYVAHKAGKRFRVYVDETRPLLQGARLTAWELQKAQIDAVLICDSMAGMLMKQGKIDAVITGADRIASNGDAANKIGTYALSVLARHHDVPFYIAAPSSTFDMQIESGNDIPIEQRDSEEVAGFRDLRTAPEGIAVYNPAFDVTPAGHITAIITERGVIEKPDAARIAEHFNQPIHGAGV